jgi:hypothetical protein
MKQFPASLAVLAIAQAFVPGDAAQAAADGSNNTTHRYVVESDSRLSNAGKAKANDESVGVHWL